MADTTAWDLCRTHGKGTMRAGERMGAQSGTHYAAVRVSPSDTVPLTRHSSLGITG